MAASLESVSTESTTKRSVGVTSIASTTGAVAGVQIAQFVAELFHLTLSTDALLGLATVLAGAFALLLGWASPSKEHQVNKIANSVSKNYATIGDLQSMANAVAVQAAAGAYSQTQIPNTSVTSTEVTGVTGSVVTPTSGGPIGSETTPNLDNPEATEDL